MKIQHINILENQILAPYAHTQAGGLVDFLALPKTHHELAILAQWATEQQLPIHIFGRLSNLVVRDGGLRGLTILTQDMRSITVEGNVITADAGADLIITAEVAMEYGLSGLEWAAGIPGSVGGAVFMNAGAYGGQCDLVVQAVTALMPDGQLLEFDGAQLDFGYRQSVFQENGGIIISAQFMLQPDDRQAIRSRMDDFNFKRANKQPLNYPSNGSVFKRPEGHFAGKLIMDAGLQGTRVGGVEVSKKHAGFMVNVNNGSGNDYEALIHLVQERVQSKFGVTLETEVRILGDN